MKAKVFSITTASILAAASFALAQETPEAAAPNATEQSSPRLAGSSSHAGSAGNTAEAPSAASGEAAATPVPAMAPAAPPPAPPAPIGNAPVAPKPPVKSSGHSSGVGAPVPPPPNQEFEEVYEPSISELEDGGDEDPLGSALMDEDRDLNVEKAMGRYQAIIARFDRQRANAAQAVFRVGECYRKLGRMEEAKAQYGRILREFSDQPALVRASQRYLFKNAGTATRTSKSSSKVTISNSGMELISPDGKDKLTFDYKFAPSSNAGMEMNAAALSQLDALKQQMAKLQAELAMRQKNDKSADVMALAQSSPETMEKEKLAVSILQELESVESNLELAKANLRNSQRQYSEMKNKLTAVEGSKAEHLPPPADADPQYAKLREEFTSVLLSKPSDKELDTAYQKLRDYVEKLYRPTLQEGMKNATLQLERAEHEIQQYEKQKNELMQKLAAQKRNPSKRF
jgi:tetratricopeptide (TPR) repeat protein